MARIIMEHRTKDNETLDMICHRIYGTSSGIVEQVLELNHHLADYGTVLPSGLVIDLPEINAIKTKQTTITLWTNQ